MRTITVKLDEKLYKKIMEKVRFHGQLSYLVRKWIVEGIKREGECQE